MKRQVTDAGVRPREVGECIQRPGGKRLGEKFRQSMWLEKLGMVIGTGGSRA